MSGIEQAIEAALSAWYDFPTVGWSTPPSVEHRRMAAAIDAYERAKAEANIQVRFLFGVDGKIVDAIPIKETDIPGLYDVGGRELTIGQIATLKGEP